MIVPGRQNIVSSPVLAVYRAVVNASVVNSIERADIARLGWGDLQKCLSGNNGGSSESAESLVDRFCWASTISMLSVEVSDCSSEPEMINETHTCVARSFAAWLASKSRNALTSSLRGETGIVPCVLVQVSPNFKVVDTLPTPLQRAIGANVLLLRSRSH